MVLLVLFLRVSLELCDLKLALLVTHGGKLLFRTSLIIYLDSFVRQRIPHTKVHERVQNDDVQVLVEFVDEVSQVSSDLLQVHLGDLDLLRVLKVDELRMSKNFEAPQELRHGELIWMDPLRPLDVLKYDVEGLYEVVDLLQEILLTVLLHVVLLLL